MITPSKKYRWQSGRGRQLELVQDDRCSRASVLDTEFEIQKVWAKAYANRAVPQYVFGGGGEGGAPVGGDGEVNRFMQLMTVDAAKRLSYDRGITPVANTK